jgi:hypothetical protein
MYNSNAKLIMFLLLFIIVDTAHSEGYTITEATAYTITGAEYFIDVDPGEGNGTPLAPKDDAFDSSLEQIDMSNLTLPQDLKIGYHYLSVRMKNQDGIWGLASRQLFKVVGTKTIQAAEYFVNYDPGEGNATPLEINNGTVDISDIDTSDLTVGINRFFIRMQNSEGDWGPARQFDIEVLERPTMQAADYYVNTFPESGEGQPLNAYDGTFDGDTEQFKGILDTANMDIGTYTLFVRAQNSHHRWGEVVSKQFEVRLPPHISGRVFTDIGGWKNLSISNAHVSLAGTSYSATTNDNGDFVIMNMPPGDYTLTINSPDFYPYTQTIKWTGKQPIQLNLPPVERGQYTRSDIEKIIRKYDPSMDEKVSLEEAIHALKTVSGFLEE